MKDLLADRTRLVIFCLIAITVIKGFLYASIVPAWQAPDEPGYFKEISVLDQGRFQSFTGHPPLYAVTSYLPYKIAPEGNARILAVRLVSVFFAVLCVYYAYKSAKCIFPNDKSIQVLAPAIASFVPQFTFISASVNSDSMLAAVFSLLCYLSVLTIKEGLTFKRSIAIISTAAAGVLTKERIIAAFPVIILVLIYGLIVRYKDKLVAYWEGDISAREAVLYISLLVAAIVLFPFLRDRALTFLIEGFSLAQVLHFRSTLQMDHVISLGVRLFKHFWGYFGWLDVPMAPWFYAAYEALSILAAIGLVLGSSLALIRARWSKKEKRTNNSASLAVQLLFIILSVLASAYGVFTYDYLTRGGGQGRYLFMVIVPISILYAAGLGGVFPKRFRAAVVPTLVFFLGAMNLGALLYVIYPYYY